MNKAFTNSLLTLSTCLVIWVSVWALLPSPALSQTIPGPSPASDFDDVLNLPGDEAVITGASNESVGRMGRLVQLNVSDGGRIGRFFDANVGSEVNISGGTVGGGFVAGSGGLVNISGGEVGSGFDARGFSEVNISGGTFGENFVSFNNSEVELFGGEYRLNGAVYSGSTITLADDDFFTGTFADGSTFLFDEASADALVDVTLTVVPLPPLDLTPITITDPVTSGPSGLREGQTLIVAAGGSLRDNFAVIGATLNVEGGFVGEGLEVSRGEVNISGGTVDLSILAFPDSLVNVSGGTVDFLIVVFDRSQANIDGGTVGGTRAEAGSLVNISGGTVDGTVTANSGSEVNIDGGTIFRMQANSESVVNISGGAISIFDARNLSDVEFIGGEFRLNGADFSGGTISLDEDDIFTGTLADGSSFVLSGNVGEFFPVDRLSEVTLTAVPLPPADLGPIVITDPVSSGPSGLRAGQTLTVAAGGSLRASFSVVDATLNIEDGVVGNTLEVSGGEVNISEGTIGDGFDAFGSEVNISGGTIGEGFDAFGSEVNISSGTVGQGFNAFNGSVVNISGGIVEGGVIGREFNIGQGIQAFNGSVVNISGGTVGSFSVAQMGSEVNVSGGTVGDFLANFDSVLNISGGVFSGNVWARSRSELNISGSEFFVDGMELNTLLDATNLDALLSGQSVTITLRDVTLSGELANGDPFSFDLNSTERFIVPEFTDGNLQFFDFFSPDATLTVTLTEPFLLGDCNQDGVVNFEDIVSFIMILQDGSFLDEADCNRDGLVDFSDIESFIAILMSL